jgi:acetoacetyl-CoA synthetase
MPNTSTTLWTPSESDLRDSGLARYLAWLAAERGLAFDGYFDVWRWSTTDLETFWGSLWEYFAPGHASPMRVLGERTMPGAQWFDGATLNYAERALTGDDASPAIFFQSETRPLSSIDRRELRRRVAAVAAWMRANGIVRGDRIVAYLPNIPEAVIAFLASASIGAIWSSCSPDFGAESVVERFQQIAPRLLIAVDGYTYAGSAHDRRSVVEELRGALPSLVATIVVANLGGESTSDSTVQWEDVCSGEAELDFEIVPFDHPLWILYSSGTTGAPKAIVHGHGGIVIEHLKALVLQSDVRPGDRLLWHTTTGWMMWNRLVGGLLAGAAIVLFDGSPAYPALDVLWKLCADARVTQFGAGAGFYTACMRSPLHPRDTFDLSALRAMSATGSPLPVEAYRWIYESVKRDVWLASSSGGTDVATAFLGACPTLPVVEGELQGPALGVAACAFDVEGRRVVGEVGELVITAPMPSMPLHFWNDPDGARYRESYFETWPGVWRHGDWVKFTERGSAIILGRSDSTLNRQGVRIGTSEIYRAVDSIDGVAESLVIGIERNGGGYWMPLFVVLRDGFALDDEMRDRIRRKIRESFTPRHVPDEIIAIDEVPRTLNGKKLEVPVKRILLGVPAERAVNAGAVANPRSLDRFVEIAASLPAE